MLKELMKPWLFLQDRIVHCWVELKNKRARPIVLFHSIKHKEFTS